MRGVCARQSVTHDACGAGVQVDGPSHYARASRVPLGSTVMKRRQLGALGYHLCSVNFWEWPSGSTAEEKQAVLSSLLASCVQVLLSSCRFRSRVSLSARARVRACVARRVCAPVCFVVS